MTLQRITITIPKDVLEAADKRAKELDRSRSWVVADAVRVAIGTGSEAPRNRAANRLREASPPYRSGLGTYRQTQLEADLTLTPTERVLSAERTARATGRGNRPTFQRVVTFDRYEDFLEWKRQEDLVLQ